MKTLSVSDCKGELIANDRNCCPTRTWTGSAMQSICIWVEIFWFQVWICRFWRFLAFQFPWSWCLKAAPGIGMFSKCFNIRCFSRGIVKEKLHVWLKKFLYELLSSLLCDQSDNQVADTQKRFDHYKLLQYPEREHLLPCPCDPRSRKTPGWAPTRRSPVRGTSCMTCVMKRVVSSAAQKVIMGLSTDV